MKRYILYLTLFWSYWQACYPAAGAPITEFTLNNGLDCILYKNDKVPLATIVLTFKAGAFTEDKQTNGLTHLWEHMFFKGNTKFPDQEAFNRQIQNLGIVFNGDTSSEMVRYYFTLPAAKIEQGLEFMYYAIKSPKIDENELKKEIQVVLDEYDRNASQPGFYLSRARKQSIYGEFSFLRDPLGNRDIIAQANRKVLMKIKDQVFIPKNGALLVSGFIDPVRTQAMINKIFGQWLNPSTPPVKTENKLPPFPRDNPVIIDVNPRVKVSSLRYDFDGPKARLDVQDTYIVDMLINLLQSRQGKFYKKYIESGWANSVYLGYHTQAQAGALVLSAEAEGEKLKRITKQLIHEPQKWLHQDYFSAIELTNAREKLRIQHEFAINKPSSYVKNLAFWWAITGLPYYYQYIDKLKKVTLTEIQDFLRKYLVNKPYVTSMLLTQKDARILDVHSTIKNGAVDE